MKNKFAIGIPTLNRLDLLHPALLFYIHDFPNTKIYIVDNGKQNIESKFKHPNIEIIYEGNNLGVARSWNMLCNKIYEEHDYAIILNDDIYLGRKEWEMENLLLNFKKFFYCTMQDWCAFIVPKTTFKVIGDFDVDFFPAYYEDNDYAYRIKLSGNSIFNIPFLNPFLYQASKTSEKDPNILQGMMHNKEHYKKKWGGEPSKETFLKPFNQ
jgi:GT2 family glycosyltransferase